MEIKVTKVYTEETKFGVKKVLCADDGKKYRVGSRQRFYDTVQEPGIYDLTMGDFQGKPFVKWLEYVKPLPDNGHVAESPKQSTSAPTGALTVAADKLSFERKKQDDIRLEFYTGIAKDIAIANKKDNEDIDPLTVIHTAKKLCVAHMSCLALIDAELKAIEVEDSKTVADKKVEVENGEEEEPPF